MRDVTPRRSGAATASRKPLRALVVLFVGSLVAQFFTQLVEFRNEAEAHGEAFAWKVDALLDKAGIDVETIERWTDTTPPHHEMPGSLDPRRHRKS